MVIFFIILLSVILASLLDLMLYFLTDEGILVYKIYELSIIRKIEKFIKDDNFAYPTFYDNELKIKVFNELKCLNLKPTSNNVNYVIVNMMLEDLFIKYNKAIECLKYLNIDGYEKYSTEAIKSIKNEFKNDTPFKKILLENLKELLCIVNNCHSVIKSQEKRNKVYENNLISLVECTKDFVLFFYKTTNTQDLDDKITSFKNKMEIQIKYLD